MRRRCAGRSAPSPNSQRYLWASEVGVGREPGVASGLHRRQCADAAEFAQLLRAGAELGAEFLRERVADEIGHAAGGGDDFVGGVGAQRFLGRERDHGMRVPPLARQRLAADRTHEQRRRADRGELDLVRERQADGRGQRLVDGAVRRIHGVDRGRPGVGRGVVHGQVRPHVAADVLVIADRDQVADRYRELIVPACVAARYATDQAGLVRVADVELPDALGAAAQATEKQVSVAVAHVLARRRVERADELDVARSVVTS